MAITPSAASPTTLHPAVSALRCARGDLATAVDLLVRQIGLRPELGRIAVRIWDDLDRLEHAIVSGPEDEDRRDR